MRANLGGKANLQRFRLYFSLQTDKLDIIKSGSYEANADSMADLT